MAIFTGILQESKAIFTQVKTILEGKTSVSFFSEFLRRNNKTDLLILKATKVRRDGSVSTRWHKIDVCIFRKS